ncbi:xanthine dehydrogenase family protein molybdopterin-binding subunit [Notoacmeibacter sp. MSK16QG-6]|uniref:xanthine dehydrogenase family protein molybdopterin-binding subunit n=1 Tax=Notoacmeibacter sp. MSK16QG-6 TaxID=2957982 RepID=UPI00209D3BA8|nr:xanthine dehydrogenase family protein molybdopterin-binding subunit [Notoacmeibacter sp. MSK16QG-6]MCP1198689.1 xanthine dehydrogenase family protein molybdopterin-binding subunit [Notoacmeibacter sp. MSK16QG-6]
MNDIIKGKWIGKPLDRVDGPLKVSGEAAYAAEHDIDAAIGFIVESTIANGSVSSIDISKAEKVEGVIAVLTHENAPKMKPWGDGADDRFQQSHGVLVDAAIRHYGQPVALVVAETLEQARYAAILISVIYDEKTPKLGIDRDDSELADGIDGGLEETNRRGDFEKAWGESDLTVDLNFTTPHMIQAAMEPHAAIAEWDGDRLTVHNSTQVIDWGVGCLANTFGIDKNNIRLLSPYIGGGFGSKLGQHYETILAAAAAKKLDRPVKVVQTRRNLFHDGPHRSRIEQRIRLGATKDGTLKAINFETWSTQAIGHPFTEGPMASAANAYRCDALHWTGKTRETNETINDSMRAPGEALGGITFEAAIDELAEKVGMDPLEFRLKNEPAEDPASGKPFATRDLVDCLKKGAEAFGWDARPKEPRSRMEGRKLIGYGLASAIRGNMMMEGSCQIDLSSSGHLTVRMDMTDIGTGTYTILTQIAAEALGLHPDDITVELADSDNPTTSGSGGSFGAGTSGSALWNACIAMREKLAKAGGFNIDPDGIAFDEGAMQAGDRSVPLRDVLKDSDGFSAEGSIEPGDEHDDYVQNSYGAHFCEVAVDIDTCEVEVRRFVSVFSAGRILNRKTARSQCLGGLVWGIGGALREELWLDERTGGYVNRDLAEYHLAVNRDVPQCEVIFLENPDPKSNPIGTKGIGELALCGAGGAIVNAIYNATGKRVYDLPVTLDKLM